MSLRTLCSTGAPDSLNWSWGQGGVKKIERWEAKFLRVVFKPKIKPEEAWVEFRKRTTRTIRVKWKKMKLQRWREKTAEKIAMAAHWAAYKGRNCPAADPKCCLNMEDNDVVETSLCVVYVGGQTECNEVAAQMGGFTPDGSCGTHPWPSGRAMVAIGFLRSTMRRLPKKRMVQLCTRSSHS